MYVTGKGELTDIEVEWLEGLVEATLNRLTSSSTTSLNRRGDPGL